MNKIYIFIGSTACGKTTIANRLESEIDSVEKVVTDTTRSPRKGEKDKIDYNFVSREYFTENINKYIEYNEYKNNLYGSNSMRINKVLESGKDCLICLDINGARALKEYYGAKVNVFFIDREVSKVYAAIDARVDNGEISKEESVSRKNQVLIDIESKTDSVVDMVVDNNGTIEKTIMPFKDLLSV